MAIDMSYAVFNGIPVPRKQSYWDKVREDRKESRRLMMDLLRVESGGYPKIRRKISHKTLPVHNPAISIARSPRDY